jgi:hypothetical protein
MLKTNELKTLDSIRRFKLTRHNFRVTTIIVRVEGGVGFLTPKENQVFWAGVYLVRSPNKVYNLYSECVSPN